MTRFLLVRHATTDATGRSLAGRAAGVHVDERGRQQVQALAERFAGASIAAVYSSPIERAVDTAEPIATLLGLPVVTREDFLEIDFGQWTDRAFDELDADLGFARFNTLRSCAPVPGGEFMLQAQARMVLGLEALRVDHPGQSVVVVGHGDPIRAALAHYAGVPLDLMRRLTVDLASVSIVELEECAVRIVAINDVGRERLG